MMNWKLGLLWLSAVTAATLITWQIVNVADSRVSAEPVEAAPPTTGLSVSTTTTQPQVTTSSVADATTTSSVAGSPSTTAGSSPSTTNSPASTSTPTETTEPAEWSLRTVNANGGTVVVRYRPGEVELQSATPAPGFEAEINDAGPPEVGVEFESDEIEVRIEIEWENGELSIDVEEN